MGQTPLNWTLHTKAINESITKHVRLQVVEMTHDALIGFGLAGWFVALALVETLWPRATRHQSGDGRLITNFGLTALIFLGSALPPLANFGSAMIGTGLGAGYYVAVPWAAMFVLLLLAQTLTAYWVHRLMHATPLLWRVHRVHHADTALDVSTSLRNHPFELLVTIPSAAAVTLVLGAPVSAVVAVQTLLFAGAIWEHADIALPRRLDRALAPILVTRVSTGCITARTAKTTTAITAASLWCGIVCLGRSTIRKKRRPALASNTKPQTPTISLLRFFLR